MIDIMRKHFWSLLIVFIAGILASRTLLFQKGYFNMHDDLQMMRQLEMEKCFKDGQIPCRWVPDMGYKYGFPLFNFYPPLPYLTGQVIRTFGFAYTDTAKILFAFSIIASGFGMYFLGNEFFKKAGGVLSAVFYMWAPYHAVDVYVRGAMNESWALIFFPLIFLFGYKLVANSENRSRSVVLLALSYAGLFLSHNLMVMIFTPFFVLWLLMWMYLNKFKDFKTNAVNLIVSGLASLGLSAFFTLPAIFENDLTWLKSQLIGYYDYTAHFVTINQLLISRFWGYGPSVWLEEDGMPFPAGHVHWIFSIVVVSLLTYLFLKNRNRKQDILRSSYFIILFLFLMGWLTAFMTHVRSTPIYQALPFLALVQFPWRFLTLVSFAFSLVAGAVVLLLPKKYINWTAGLLIVVCILSNWFYFLPKDGKMGNLTDQEKFSGEAWQLQLTAGIYDYLPQTAKMAPKAEAKVIAEVVDIKTGNLLRDTKIKIFDDQKGTDWLKFSVEGEASTIRINTFDFPTWKVKIDGKEVTHYVPDNESWGRMWVDVPEGKHVIEAEFVDTPIRSFSNYLSLFSWIGLVVYGMVQFSLWKKN
jgi:hypothetical protein